MAVLIKVVPDDVYTCPLMGIASALQSKIITFMKKEINLYIGNNHSLGVGVVYSTTFHCIGMLQRTMLFQHRKWQTNVKRKLETWSWGEI